MRFPLLSLCTRSVSRLPWSVRPQPTAQRTEDVNSEANDEIDFGETEAPPFDSDEIRARSFMKYMKQYSPPEDLKLRLGQIIAATTGSAGQTETEWNLVDLSNLQTKFTILNKLAEELDHRVPNSLLNEMKSIGDVYAFYSTPVENLSRYSLLARSPNRPPNVHVIEETTLFNPEDTDDPIHHGMTAYPGHNYSFNDLRHRRLLRNFKAKTYWHHYEDKTWDYRNVPKNPPWCQESAEEMDRIQPIYPEEKFGGKLIRDGKYFKYF